MEHRDGLNREIAIGDYVTFFIKRGNHSTDVHTGRVAKILPKSIRVKTVDGTYHTVSAFNRIFLLEKEIPAEYEVNFG